MSARDRLQQLGINLPDLAPTHEFLCVSLIGELAFVSGHAPFEGGSFRYCGRVGQDFDLSAGQQAAKLAVLGCLASLEKTVGSLDSIRQIVKLIGYVNCVPGFHDLPKVTDAASKLLIDLFGDSGRHARTTVGVASLPKGVAVEIELIAAVTLNLKLLNSHQIGILAK